MAAGDVVNAISSVATNGVLDIRPAAGVEWVIHNVYYANGTVEFYYTDGVNVLKFDSDTTSGARLGACFHATNTNWLQIKNLNAASVLIGYDGMQTK